MADRQTARSVTKKSPIDFSFFLISTYSRNKSTLRLKTACIRFFSRKKVFHAPMKKRTLCSASQPMKKCTCTLYCIHFNIDCCYRWISIYRTKNEKTNFAITITNLKGGLVHIGCGTDNPSICFEFDGNMIRLYAQCCCHWHCQHIDCLNQLENDFLWTILRTCVLSKCCLWTSRSFNVIVELATEISKFRNVSTRTENWISVHQIVWCLIEWFFVESEN